MAGLAGSDEWACGHPAQPGARFCPVCGQPAVGRGAPSQPLTAPLPPVADDLPPSAWPPPGAPAAAPPPRSEPDPWDSWYVPRRPSSPPPGGPEPWPVPPGGAQPPSAGPGGMWADGLGAPWADRPDAMWADGPGPSPDTPTAMLAGLRPPRDPGAPRSPRRPFGPRRPLLIVIAAATVVTIVAGIVLVKALSGSPPASGATGTTRATSSASSQDARRQAAVQLDRLLAQSVTDRAAVTNAAEDVRACGPSLSQDAQTFAHSASSRQQLLSRLASLPGRSQLPAAMLQSLTSAWQASAQVDTDLSRWAQDNATRGCHHHRGRPDAYLRASAVPETRATVAKRAFSAQWNPIARQYGLTTYRRNQL